MHKRFVNPDGGGIMTVSDKGDTYADFILTSVIVYISTKITDYEQSSMGHDELSR